MKKLILLFTLITALCVGSIAHAEDAISEALEYLSAAGISFEYEEETIQTEEKVIVKDSLIYVRDTVTVEIPKEVVKEIVPADTTSILNTSVAMSEARLEKGQLYHSLEQSGAVKTVVDTCYVTRIEEKVIYQDRPIEVPKEVKHIPTFFWWSLIFNIITVLFIAFKIYLKLKS